MLGNVAEMTNTLYQLEYYQGRSGGLAARGGHFLTAEKEMSAALRVEEPIFLGDKKQGLRPNRKPTLGLRLAIGAPLMTDRSEIAALEDAWDEYLESARQVSPAGLSTAPVGIQTDVKAEDARGHLANVKARLGAGQLPEAFLDPINQDLGRLEASLAGIDVIRKQAETDSAQSWVRIGVFAAHQYMLQKHRRPGLETVIKSNEALPAKDENLLNRLYKRLSDLDGNMDNYLSAYYDALTQMGSLNQATVKESLDRYSPASVDGRTAWSVFAGHYDLLIKNRALNRETLVRDLNAAPVTVEE
jgi:hypothetical protein